MRSLKLTALICAAALLGVVGLAASPALADQSETVFFEAPRDLLEVTGATRAATIAKLQSLGVHALRIVLYWGDVAPKPDAKKRPHFNQDNPAAYKWGYYDALIDDVTALHWTVLLTVSGGPSPRWATAGSRDQFTNPSATDFRQFTEAVGRHYGKLVKLYSIWNEPNQPQYLRPQYTGKKLTSPTLYRSLFLAGYDGLKASGNFSGMKVLMGETSPVGVPDAGIPAPLAFLRGLLCLSSTYKPIGHCSELPAYGYAQHPYSVAAGPFWKGPAVGGQDDVTIGTLGRLVTALNKAAAVHAIRPDMPIYLTEFGVQSKPPNPVLGVPYQQQAEFDAISEKLAWENPRVVSFDQYLLRDDPPKVQGFSSGLETYKGVPKLLYDGFRLPLVVARTSTGVSFWGIVRPFAGSPKPPPKPKPTGPTAATGTTGTTGASGATGTTGSGTGGAVAASVGTELTIQYSENGGRSWRTLESARTDSSGAWTAGGHWVPHREWRVKWRSSSGTTYYGAPTRCYNMTSGKIDY
jgi:hypothetical protein